MIVTVFAVKRHREGAMFFSATILITSSTSRSTTATPFPHSLGSW